MRGAALSAVAGEPAETARYLGGWAMGDDGALSMGGPVRSCYLSYTLSYKFANY